MIIKGNNNFDIDGWKIIQYHGDEGYMYEVAYWNNGDVVDSQPYTSHYDNSVLGAIDEYNYNVKYCNPRNTNRVIMTGNRSYIVR